MTPSALSIKLYWLQGTHFQLGQIARSQAHPCFTKLMLGSTSETTTNTFIWVDPLQLSHLAETSLPRDFQDHSCRFWKRTWEARQCFCLLDPEKGWVWTSRSPDAVSESCERRKWSKGQTAAYVGVPCKEKWDRMENGEKRYSWSHFPSYSQHGPSACAWSEVWCCKEKFQTHDSFMLESVDLIV